MPETLRIYGELWMARLSFASQLTLTLWFALFKAHDYYDYAQKEQTPQKGE